MAVPLAGPRSIAAITLVIAVALAACGGGDALTTDQILGADTDLTLRGRVIHAVDQPHTGAGPFTIGPDSHARIDLDAVSVDGPGFPLGSIDLPISAVPFTFTLAVDRSALAEARAQHHDMVALSARVFHAAGDTIQVGDLVTEAAVGSQPIDDLELVATMLEACTAPDAGGYCR